MYSEDNYILWLNSITGIDTEKKLELIDYFGGVKNLYEADIDDINGAHILRGHGAAKIVGSHNFMDEELERLEKSPVNFISYKDSKFPLGLHNMKSPPLGLYVWGEIPENVYPKVSIIGSRKMTSYGEKVSAMLSEELTSYGINIVSGMAYGIDTEAHKACIKNGGKTIAVMGTGADVCYPAGNRDLRDSIIQNGCVVSEYPLGMKATRFTFPYRNRIIACMSGVTIIVEGAEASGTLNTANHVLDNGRKLMAVPGNIFSHYSKGTNKLISEGCRPCLSARDVLDELNIKITKKEQEKNEIPDITEEELEVFKHIGYDDITVDELCIKTKMNIDVINGILIMLELKGCITKVSGQKFVRTI